MSYQRLAPLATALLLAFAGCGGSIQPAATEVVPPAAEWQRDLTSAVRDHATLDRPPFAVERFQMIKTLQLDGGVVVVYAMPGVLAGRNEGVTLGYVFAAREAGRWNIRPGGETTIADPSSGSSHTTRGDKNYTVVLGHVPTDITAVEARLNSGRTVADVPAQGLFAIIIPGSQSVCELRLRGADGGVESVQSMERMC